MKYLKILFLVPFLFACHLFQPEFQPTPHQVMEGKASYVIDGDTFYFSFDRGKFKSRLSGVTAPTMTDKNGKAAFEFLRELIHQKSVRIEYVSLDDQGRWLVNATMASGEDINQIVRVHLATLN